METREQQALRLFNSACECIENEKYKEACDYLVKSSQLSGADARYILGIWYLFGVDCIDLKQDIWGAIFCLIKSAYKGNMSSKIFLNTFLDIDIDVLNLTEQNIKSIIDNIVIYKCKDIESTIKEHKYKILEDIQNPYIVQPVIKIRQPTLLEQHNISIQYSRKKHAKYKPKLKHNKEKEDEFKPKNIHNKINDKYLWDLLIKDNRQLKQENEMLKQELQNIYIMSNNNVQMRQQIISQNTQINTNTIQQNEYMQTINFNQQIPNGEMIQTQQIQPIAQQNMYNIYQKQNNGQIIDYNYLQQQNTLNTNYQEQLNNLNNIVNYTNQNHQNNLEQINSNWYF